MDIDMGKIIRQELEKTGWSISQFAQKIRRDRTIVYYIFKRKVFDTDLLYDISMALNIDLFKYYTEALERENEMIRLRKSKEPYKICKTRKIFLEVEVSEDEYQDFMKKRLWAYAQSLFSDLLLSNAPASYLLSAQTEYHPGTISGR